MTWIEYLKTDVDALSSFVEYLAQLDSQYTDELQRAGDLTVVARLQGARRVVADLQHSLSAKEREERAHDRYREACGLQPVGVSGGPAGNGKPSRR